MRVKALEWSDIGYGLSAECAFGRYIVERNAHIDGRAGLIYPENVGNTFPHDFFGTETECQAHAASDLLTRASALFEHGDNLRDAALIFRTPDEFEILLSHLEKSGGSQREKLDTALKAVAAHGFSVAT